MGVGSSSGAEQHELGATSGPSHLLEAAHQGGADSLSAQGREYDDVLDHAVGLKAVHRIVRRRRVRVRHCADVLGITVGHPDDVGVDRHEPTRRLLAVRPMVGSGMGRAAFAVAFAASAFARGQRAELESLAGGVQRL